MKNVKRKNIFRTADFFSAVAAMMLFVSACEKDNSSPDSGSDDRDKYIRAWTCNETSQQQGTSTYSITISKDNTSPDGIIVKNFYNLGNATNTIMIVDGNNVAINSQNVSGNTISGTGVYHNSSLLTFSFTTYDGITVDTVSISAH